jgi:GNAT superfamily N-acetyltransferase
MSAGATASQPPSCSDVTFLSCADTPRSTLQRLYENVLVPSFPPVELIDLDCLEASSATPAGSRSVLAMRSGEPVGAALAESDPSGSFVLLSYLAVRADQRSAGIGEALVSEALDRWRRDLNPTAVLAEVEDPRFHDRTPYGDPVARLRFYQRLGAGLLPLPYFQPRISPEMPRVTGMLLITFAFGANAVPSGPLAAYLEWHVASAEHAPPPDDEAYRALLTAVSAYHPGDVPLWALDRAGEVPYSR